MDHARRTPDPGWVREQTALQDGRRHLWLVPGGLLAAIALGVLIAALRLTTAIPATGIVIIALLYAAMLACSLMVRPPRTRNRVLAALMGSIALAALVVLLALLVHQRLEPFVGNPLL